MMNMFATTIIVSTSIVAFATAADIRTSFAVPRTNPGYPSCNVCGVDALSGEDGYITSPEVILDVPTFGEVSCAIFSQAGYEGYIEETYCDAMPELAGPCGCQFTPERVSVPETSPGYPSCNVCGMDAVTGDAGYITNPEVVLDVPRFGAVSCIMFSQAGFEGYIEEMFCEAMPLLAGPCGCEYAPNERASIPVTNPGHPPCNVCGQDVVTGEAGHITNPEVVLDVPTFGEISCAIFSQVGIEGYIEEMFCDAMPQLAGPCGCQFQVLPEDPPVSDPGNNADGGAAVVAAQPATAGCTAASMDFHTMLPLILVLVMVILLLLLWNRRMWYKLRAHQVRIADASSSSSSLSVPDKV